MELIYEIRPGTVLPLNQIGTTSYLPLLVPSTISKERADLMEVEVSWNGMTGGLVTNVAAIRARGYAKNSGIVFSGSPLVPGPGDAWGMGRILMSRNQAGAINQNGEFLLGNQLLAGRGVAQFFAQTGGAASLIDPVVIVAVILTTGTAYSGGNIVFERVSFYNSMIPATR